MNQRKLDDLDFYEKYLLNAGQAERDKYIEENRQKTKLNSANVRNDFISNRPDPFDRWINSQKF